MASEQRRGDWGVLVMVLGWLPPAPLASCSHSKARDLEGLWYLSASGSVLWACLLSLE